MGLAVGGGATMVLWEEEETVEVDVDVEATLAVEKMARCTVCLRSSVPRFSCDERLFMNPNRLLDDGEATLRRERQEKGFSKLTPILLLLHSPVIGFGDGAGTANRKSGGGTVLHHRGIGGRIGGLTRPGQKHFDSEQGLD